MHEPFQMDCTNMARIASDIPLKILLVDVDSAELVASFDYIWAFDANLNWRILKTPD